MDNGNETGMRRSELLRRLTILDGKSTVLLSISAIILTIFTIPIATHRLDGVLLNLSVTIAATFLAVSLLALSVLRVNWDPTEGLLNYKSKAFKFAIILTALGLIQVATFIVSAYRMQE